MGVIIYSLVLPSICFFPILRSHVFRYGKRNVLKARSLHNQTLTHIYQRVYETFPDLCNNEFLCSDCCGGIHSDPEWHHIVRGALSRSKDKEFSRVQKRADSHGFWFFAEINNL